MLTGGIIYGLYDPITDELKYIGRTQGKLITRLTNHMRECEKAKHTKKNKWLLFLKKNNLKPKIKQLDVADSIDELNKKEIDWIEKTPNLLNSAAGGFGFTTDQLNELWKNKDYRDKVLNKDRAKIVCVNTGEIFESIKSAMDKTGLKRVQIGRVLAGRRKSIHGLVFKYCEDRSSYKKPRKSPILRLSTGKIYDSITDLVNETGWSYPGIEKVLNGTRPSIYKEKLVRVSGGVT